MRIQTLLNSLILGCILTATASGADWGTLKGQFLYGKEGTAIPKANKLTITKDVEVCGKEDLFNEDLVINEKNRGIANVLIWVDKPKSIHPDYEETAGAEVVLDNKLCRFEPRCVAVRVGQTLVVGNPDPVGHNSMITFLANKQVNPIIPAGGKIEFGPDDIKKAEKFPVKVSCSIHPWMQARLVVQDHPYIAVTDADGKFELKNLPAGKLTLKVFHEKNGWLKSINVDGKDVKLKRGGKYAVNLATGSTERTYIVDPKQFK